MTESAHCALRSIPAAIFVCAVLHQLASKLTKASAFGFFNAYGNPVYKDSVDYVIHLGDYIYEYKNGDYGWGQSNGRVPLPDREIYTLYDYRKRHATYRTDGGLLASHSKFPWIPVWYARALSELSGSG